MTDNIRRHLQSFYASHFPDRRNLQVTNLVRLTGGMTNEMYAFDVEYGGTDSRREELVLRIYSGDGADETSAREFLGTRWLHDAGYPVPRLYLMERATLPMARPIVIMERIKGKALWQRVVDLPEDRRGTLHALFCELLYRLHRIDWRRFPQTEAARKIAGPYAFVDEYLEKERDSLRRYELAGFSPIVDWLQARRDDVPCLQPTLIHGDFHYQNILLREDDSPVVIDWTTLRVSDPRIDLAWTLLLQQTHVNVQLRDYILKEYERLSGAEVQHLAWFETLACLWRLRYFAIVLSGHGVTLGMHSETAVIIKRQLEPYKLVYKHLLERTAITVPEVEALFATMSCEGICL